MLNNVRHKRQIQNAGESGGMQNQNQNIGNGGFNGGYGGGNRANFRGAQAGGGFGNRGGFAGYGGGGGNFNEGRGGFNSYGGPNGRFGGGPGVGPNGGFRGGPNGGPGGGPVRRFGGGPGGGFGGGPGRGFRGRPGGRFGPYGQQPNGNRRRGLFGRRRDGKERIKKQKKPRHSATRQLFSGAFSTLFGFSSYNLNENINYRKKRAILYYTPKSRIPPIILYRVYCPLNASKIKSALQILMKTTCLKFSYSLSPSRAVITYKPNPFYDSVFDSRLTKIGTVYVPPDKTEVSKILRETLYLLGLEYEVRRYDRNYYIKLNLQAIDPQFFRKFAISHCSIPKKYDLGYEYTSIMHYPPDEYAQKGKKTFSAIQKDMNLVVGKSLYPTFDDIKLVNLKHCMRAIVPHLPCRNYGYSDPSNIGKCRCLPFYSGIFCEFFKKNKGICAKKNIFEATQKWTRLELFLDSSCFFLIKSSNRGRILLKLGFVNKKLISAGCHRSVNLEVRYSKDLSHGGLKYPQGSFKYSVLSEGNKIILYSIYAKKYCILSLEFKEV
uniref:Metalloendopeptidase n=1 Tax=Strongyloides stercoralis TaxID=6248 RepID=A0AAF5DA26_STRER